MLDFLRASGAIPSVDHPGLTEANETGLWFGKQVVLIQGRPDLYTHSLRSGSILTELAKHLGMSEGKILILRRTALLHDIGKLSIPEKILNKKDPLSEEEKSLIRTHVDIGYRLVKPRLPTEAAILLGQHWYQPDPYPDPADYEPVGSEIASMQEPLALADQVDATLVDKRKYRDAPLTAPETREYLLRSFKDKELVDFAINVGTHLTS